MEPLKRNVAIITGENTFSCLEQGFSILGQSIRRPMTIMRYFRRNPQTCLEVGVYFWYHTVQPSSNPDVQMEILTEKELWVPLKSVAENGANIPSLLIGRIDSWWRSRINGLCQTSDTERMNNSSGDPDQCIESRVSVFVETDVDHQKLGTICKWEK